MIGVLLFGIFMMDLNKACTSCKINKPFSDFHASGKAADGRASWCKACANSVARGYRKRSYDSADKRKWHLSYRYGLTPEAVETMRRQQGGRCALCTAALDKFHIDHCHNTGVVRGILCHQCNVRLGGWDDLVWRMRALRYLGISASEQNYLFDDDTRIMRELYKDI